MSNHWNSDMYYASYIPWTHFVTQTYRQENLNVIMPCVLAWGRKMGRKSDWLARVELGSRNGRVHIHMLVSTPYWQTPSDLFRLKAWGNKKWGFADVRKWDPTDGSLAYILEDNIYEMSRFKEKRTVISGSASQAIKAEFKAKILGQKGLTHPIWCDRTLLRIRDFLWI